MNYKKYKKKTIYFIVIILFFLICCLYLFNKNFKSIINIILISFMLAYTIKPVQDVISIKFKMNKSKSALIVIFVVLAMIIICGFVLAPKFLEEIQNISNIIDEINGLINYLNDKMKINKISIAGSFYDEINEKSNLFIKELLYGAIENLINISSNIVSYAICPIIIYYFLSDGEKIFNYVLLIVPVKKRNIVKKIIVDIDKKLSAYIISQLFLCVIVGIFTFILLMFLKVKFALWLALLSGIFNIIPYFGPVFGIVPAAISGLIDSPMKSIYVIIGLIVIQQIEGNILSPKVTGDSTDMHPFVIILLLLIGERFAGFIGMIIIIPIAVVIKVLYDDINHYLF